MLMIFSFGATSCQLSEMNLFCTLSHSLINNEDRPQPFFAVHTELHVVANPKLATTCNLVSGNGQSLAPQIIFYVPDFKHAEMKD